jgi:hypothetical protein
MTKSQWAQGILLSLVLSTPSAVIAQQPPEQENPPEQQEPAAADTDTKKPAPEQNSDSPFEYESSEQISEDLSVSFPVDI